MTAERRNNGRRRAATARRQHGKHFSAAMNQHATIEGLLEAVFSVKSELRLYNENWREKSGGRRSELQMSNGSSFFAMRNFHFYQQRLVTTE
jgi:hypothetical protein